MTKPQNEKKARGINSTNKTKRDKDSPTQPKTVRRIMKVSAKTKTSETSSESSSEMSTTSDNSILSTTSTSQCSTPKTTIERIESFQSTPEFVKEMLYDDMDKYSNKSGKIKSPEHNTETSTEKSEKPERKQEEILEKQTSMADKNANGKSLGKSNRKEKKNREDSTEEKLIQKLSMQQGTSKDSVHISETQASTNAKTTNASSTNSSTAHPQDNAKHLTCTGNDKSNTENTEQLIKRLMQVQSTSRAASPTITESLTMVQTNSINNNPDYATITETPRLTEGQDPTTTVATQKVNLSQNGNNLLGALLARIEETSEENWLKETQRIVNSRYDARIPRGGWKIIHEQYCRNFGDVTLLEVKKKYNYIKYKDSVNLANIITTNSENNTNDTNDANSNNNGDNDTNNSNNNMNDNNSENIEENADTSENNSNTNLVSNAKLYQGAKKAMQKTEEKYCIKKEERIRTRKIENKKVNHQLIEYMNRIAEERKDSDKIKTLEDLSNYLYAFQKAYELAEQEGKNLTKKKSTWKSDIMRKIEKYEKQEKIIKEWKGKAKPNIEMRRILKEHNVHSNNSVQMAKLVDKIEEKKTVYKKKIRMAENRMKMSKDNYQFECFRSKFYRKLAGEELKVSEEIDVEETVKYWEDIWQKKQKERSHEEMLENTKRCKIQVETNDDKIMEMIEIEIKKVQNWKAPGLDCIYNFTIKKAIAYRAKLIELITEAIKEPEKIPEEFYVGTTYLLAKAPNTSKPEELRPITCLSNIYKLISKMITNIVYETADINNVISINQYGVRKGVQGSKEQILINKLINEGTEYQLKTCWIDVKKAYDSVNHEYLIELLQKMQIPEYSIIFVKRMLQLQQTRLNLNGKEIGKIKIKNGILQGDALSPLLFVLAIEPMSTILNKKHQIVEANEIRRNHLAYIDDMKLMARTEEELRQMCKTTEECLEAIGLELNAKKSASNIEEAIGKKMEGHDVYKYLGIIEDNSSRIEKEKNKEAIKNKIIERVDKITNTNLTGKNMIHAINEYAITLIDYHTGLVDMKEKDHQEIDKEIKKVMYKKKLIRNAANIDRIYIRRKEQGRGLSSVVEKVENILLKFHVNLEENQEKEQIIRMEKRNTTELGVIKINIANKYGLEENLINGKTLKKAQYDLRMERITTKKMHGRIFQNDEQNLIDLKKSATWLTHGYTSAQEEASLTKLQDRNIYTKGNKCFRCKAAKWTVDHVATNCGALLHTAYMIRHDAVVKYIHQKLAVRHGLTKVLTRKNYRMESVMGNEKVKIKSDVPIRTDVTCPANRPDLVVEDKMRKKITIIEVRVSSRPILAKSEAEKKQKYQLLAGDLRGQHLGYTVEIVPIVISFDGAVTRNNAKYMKTLGMGKKDLANIQILTMKRTLDMINADIFEEGTEERMEEA